ncbi:hypothetical protein GmHk_04G011599 [Glycine max]|nr:hypothetical protein GmHk_04G011599 [Glycine max]
MEEIKGQCSPTIGYISTPSHIIKRVPTQQDAALPNFLSNFYACGRESAVCLEESVVLAAKSGHHIFLVADFADSRMTECESVWLHEGNEATPVLSFDPLFQAKGCHFQAGQSRRH